VCVCICVVCVCVVCVFVLCVCVVCVFVCRVCVCLFCVCVCCVCVCVVCVCGVFVFCVCVCVRACVRISYGNLSENNTGSVFYQGYVYIAALLAFFFVNKPYFHAVFPREDS
jgi:hypothetical protein